MKFIKSLSLSGALLALPIAAQAQITNPVPSVTLAWNASTSAGVTNYNLYYGVASGVYTNRTALGTNLTVTVQLPGRGLTYFFAATAMAGGLESPYSNEASYSPPVVPSSPTNMRVTGGQ